MAESKIPLQLSQIKAAGNIATGIDWCRKGNVITVFFNQVHIEDTVNRTLLGTMPPGLYPQFQIFSPGFASGGVVSYAMIDMDGKIYGYRSVKGNILMDVTYGVV